MRVFFYLKLAVGAARCARPTKPPLRGEVDFAAGKRRRGFCLRRRGVRKMCQWHIFSHRPQQLCCEEGSCLKRNCLRRPYSFCASKKNMERQTGQRGAQTAPLWKLPKYGGKNSIVPHNKRLNLRVQPSYAAQDAAAFWRLFGATEISPRSVFAPPLIGEAYFNPSASHLFGTSLYTREALCEQLYLLPIFLR